MSLGQVEKEKVVPSVRKALAYLGPSARQDAQTISREAQLLLALDPSLPERPTMATPLSA